MDPRLRTYAQKENVELQKQFTNVTHPLTLRNVRQPFGSPIVTVVQNKNEDTHVLIMILLFHKMLLSYFLSVMIARVRIKCSF